MRHNFEKMEEDEVKELQTQALGFCNPEILENYYKCKECGLVVYEEYGEFLISWMSGLSVVFIGKSSEVITCDEYAIKYNELVIREIIE